jgi:uroporphyrinogen decarboxylase
MTRRELVAAAIEHRETPRVPYNIRPDGEMQKKLRARLGWEVPRPKTLGRLDLNEDWLDNDVEMIAIPWWTWGALEPDWRGIYPPRSPAKSLGTGNYTVFYNDLKALRESTDRYILATVYGSHFEKANFARGIENFLMDIGGDFAFAKALCTKIIDRNMVMLEHILDCSEIDGVLLGSDWGSQRGLLMSPDTWDELIRPGEQREYDLVHGYGKHVWIHSCGKIDALIPRLADMGVDVLNPLQPECMDIDDIKRSVGDRMAFWGGINTQQLLPFGTPEEVKAEARRTRDLLSCGGGYIFAPAQDVQGDVPFENLDALLSVAREGKR